MSFMLDKNRSSTKNYRLGFAIKFALVSCVCLMLTACSSMNNFVPSVSLFGDKKPKYSPRVVHLGQPVPKGGGVYKVGKPYKVGGNWYHPAENRSYDRTGIASWYGEDFHGRKTANGEVYDMNALTAAHPTLPMPSYVEVTNLSNGRSIVVRVNDRGPYAHGRIIDLSKKSASLLDFQNKGTARVRVRYLRPAPLNGDTNYERQALARQPWFGGNHDYAPYPQQKYYSLGGNPHGGYNQ